jgi:hypothetical protein
MQETELVRRSVDHYLAALYRIQKLFIVKWGEFIESEVSTKRQEPPILQIIPTLIWGLEGIPR